MVYQFWRNKIFEWGGSSLESHGMSVFGIFERSDFLDKKKEAIQFMSKLNFIMENEINPSTYKNRKLIEELRNVEQKYNTFKNTIQKDTSFPNSNN